MLFFKLKHNNFDERVNLQLQERTWPHVPRYIDSFDASLEIASLTMT